MTDSGAGSFTVSYGWSPLDSILHKRYPADARGDARDDVDVVDQRERVEI